MPTHDPHRSGHEPDPHEPQPVDASKGFEATDVRISGIVVFLVALSVFVAVAGILAYGIGKAIDARMAKEDGPRSKWAQQVDVRPLGNLPASPELQNKMAELTQRFPTPRVQTDDGNQDVADLHAREDLLLDNYTWADQSQGKVRIPIERAIELLAQRGLPVAPPVERTPLLAGDSKSVVAVPLTSGFARTGYELEQAAAKRVEGGRQETQK
jgi:hypothetical protein